EPAAMHKIGTFLFALFFGVVCAPRSGATVYNSNGSAADVQQIHDTQAQSGDTITIPAGTFTWMATVTISKGIILQGTGIGSTIVRDDVQTPAKLLQWTIPAGTQARLTGIEFQDGGRVTIADAYPGVLHVDGLDNRNGSTFRWDNCKWADIKGVWVFDTVIGVIDHNTFY